MKAIKVYNLFVAVNAILKNILKKRAKGGVEYGSSKEENVKG